MESEGNILSILIIIGGIALLAFVGYVILCRLEFQDEASDKWNLMGLVTGGVLWRCVGRDCKITPYMMEQITAFALKMTPDDSLPIGYANFPKGIYSFFKKQPDLDEVIDKLIKCISFSERRSFVRLLFRLVAEDDGLSNDRWNAVVEIMYKMHLNKANYDYLLRCYAPLRKKADGFDEYFNASNATSSSENKASGASGSSATQNATAESAVSQLQPFFNVLGLAVTATRAEVQAAYRQMALLHHPDLPKNACRQAECEEMMAKINDAYARIIATY